VRDALVAYLPGASHRASRSGAERSFLGRSALHVMQRLALTRCPLVRCQAGSVPLHGHAAARADGGHEREIRPNAGHCGGKGPILTRWSPSSIGPVGSARGSGTTP
jgi:hypothetical protein